MQKLDREGKEANEKGEKRRHQANIWPRERLKEKGLPRGDIGMAEI